MMHNYSQLVERISRASRLSVDEINRRVEAKRAKLSGLVSREGAAQIVAAELGVSFDKEKMKISELVNGMKSFKIIGKIVKMFPVREYSKNNRQGKIGSFVIADDSSNIRVVLWDTNHISLIENGTIKEGDVIEINGATTRNNEVHLTGFSDIKISPETLPQVKSEKIFHEIPIKSISPSNNASIRAFIARIFDPKFFKVCEVCGKRISEINECAEHGKVAGARRALLSLVLDDGTETMRAVLFSEQLKLLFNENELEGEEFFRKKKELEGKEMIFSGQARKNKLFDSLELFVEDAREVDIDKLLETLDKR